MHELLPTDPDALLTYEQVGKMLNVTPEVIRRMVADGDWPAPTLYGKQLRWRMGRIREFMAAQQLVQDVKRQAGKDTNSDRIDTNSDDSSGADRLGGSRKTKPD